VTDAEHDCPLASVVLPRQVPEVIEKSAASSVARGELLSTTGPPFAVNVTVPQLLEAPTLVAGHVRDAGLAERLPLIPVPLTVVEGLPLLVLTVMLVLSTPVDCGVKVMVPSEQL